MKNIPKEIYLNLGIPKKVFDITKDDIDFKQLNNVGWSTDKINDQDLKFVLSDVSNCKRDETLELLEEIMTKVKEANEEVENGIYDPMLEVAKHILNNYKIERR